MTTDLTLYLPSFGEELLKQANKLDLLRRAAQAARGQAGAIGAGAGTGAALGGALGGLGAGVKSYQDAREVGAGRGDALRYGLSRSLSGASRGAMAGGALGAAAGGLGGARARQAASGLIEKDVAGVPARFAQRQLHSLTGYADKAQLQAMRGGSYDAKRRLQQAGTALAGADPSKSSFTQRLVGAVKNTAPKTQVDKAMNEVRRASSGLEAAQAAEEAGLTSIPGVLKGLAGRAEAGGKQLSPLQAVKTMTGEQWKGSGLGGKALMLGFPASGLVSAAQAPADASEGRAERVGKALATGLAYSTPMGIVGQSALAGGLGGGAGLVGAGIDKTLGRRRRQVQQGMLPEQVFANNPPGRGYEA